MTDYSSSLSISCSHRIFVDYFTENVASERKFFIVNSKEKGVASEISLCKDLINVKTRSNDRVRVLKPHLFVLVCLLIELHSNLKVCCLYLFLFFLNWGFQ